jgi:hypothetical protein
VLRAANSALNGRAAFVQCKIADCIPADCGYVNFNNEIQQSAAASPMTPLAAVCSFADQVQDFDR